MEEDKPEAMEEDKPWSSSSSDGMSATVQVARKNNLLVIRFKEINVTVDHTDAVPGYETFGKKLLGCFCGLCLKIMRPKPKSTKIQVLKKASGYIMPGTMTLLLGPPGSGKSTLLKVIEGNLHKDKQLKQDGGVVLYNKNVLTSNIAPTKPIAYITERRNVHLPVLTVRETLEFVQDCMQETHEDRFMLHSVERLPSELSGCKNPYLEYVLQSFGLKGIEYQRVGSIRDGDRTRLAVAEAAVGTHSVMLFDHPSSGQDSLFTYDVLSMLQSVTRLHQAATVMAIPQVAPEFYNLFDRVIILSEGRIIFQGVAQAAENYFKGLGFKRPPEIDTGTFLEDIAAGDGAQYMESRSTLLGADDLAAAYEQSEHYRDVLRIVSDDSVVNTFWTQAEASIQVSMRETTEGADLLVTQAPAIARSNSMVAGDKVTAVCTDSGEVQYVDGKTEAVMVAEMLDKSVTGKGSLSIQVERRLDEEGDEACYRKQFGPSMLRKWFIVTKILIKRQALFAVRLKKLLLLRLFQATLVGLFIGSLFYHTGDRLVQSKMNSMRSIGFVSMMHMLLLNIVQLPVHMIVHRPVFYKQRAQHLFGVSSYIVAHGVVNLPQAAVEAFIYSISVYFLAKLTTETASGYFHYWGVLFLISYLGSWYMILVSAVAPILEVATVLAGVVVVVNLLFSGFPIILSAMKPWWKWMLYVIPTRWGNVIFSSTQFKDRRYKDPCSAHISFGFCLFHPTRSVGDAFLKFYDLEGGTHKLVLAYSLIVIFMLGVIFLSYLAYKKVEAGPATPPERPAAVMLQDTVKPHGIDLEVAENGGVQEDKKWTTNLPFQSVTLTFQDLKFIKKATRRYEQRTVLDNVSGYAKPGEMLAIVGNMYSGKKTLFSCISGRVPSGKLEGDVLYNGSKLNTETLCRISGFVDKESRLQPFLTVKETLEFSANLRLGRHVPSSAKAAHVNRVIELIGLSKLSNQLVGSLGQAVSRLDEKCKTLKIGVELAANPGVLFLEDPTYRFDSYSTRRVLQLLQKLAFGGRTIITTLDHPSGEALAFFDSALILKLGGEQVYFGPVGWNCSVMLDYFGAIPGVPKYEGSFSPLTYVLDLVGGGIRPRQPVGDFAATYKQSSLHEAMNEEIKVLVLEQHKLNKRVLVDAGYPSSYRTQIAMVFLRNQRALYRNVLYTFSRLVGSIMVGLLMGTLYLQMSLHRILSMTSVSVLPYMQALLISGLISNNVILQLGTDRAVYKREIQARMYARFLYPLSWAIAELPYLLLSTLVFLAISNSMAGIGIGSVTIFFKYWMGLFLFSVVVTYYGIFITLLSHHPLLAVSLVSITTSLWVGGSGVSVPRYDTRFYKWLYWVDPFQYVVNILTATGFHCNTGSPACRSCRVSVRDCAGCGCDRLRDVEAMMVRLTGSSNRPAVFVWDRLVSSRLIELQRNRRDYAMLGAMVAVFACLALVVFKLRNLRTKRSWQW